jgi:hypothetical protein
VNRLVSFSRRLGRRTSLVTLAGVIALAGPLAAAASLGAPSALAASPGFCSDEYSAFVAAPSIATAKAVGVCEVNRRLTDLGTVRGKVVGAKTLTSSDRSRMESRIDADVSGLRSLRSKIEADSTLAALQADLHAIVWDYRVYVLVIRQDWLTYAADSELAAVNALKAFDGRLTTWIAQAKGAGYDTSTVEADQARLESDFGQVSSSVSGLPASLLGLTVGQYNAGTAEPAMDAAAQTLAGGWSTLIDARQAAEKAVADIKALA